MLEEVHRVEFIDQGDGVSVAIEVKKETPTGEIRFFVTADIDTLKLLSIQRLARKYLKE